MGERAREFAHDHGPWLPAQRAPAELKLLMVGRRRRNSRGGHGRGRLGAGRSLPVLGASDQAQTDGVVPPDSAMSLDGSADG